MLRVVDSLRDFARWTTSLSEFRELRNRTSPPDPLSEDGLIYRLRTWPELPPALRNARMLRLLSVMSSRLVNRHWMVSQCGKPAEVDALLALLVTEGCVEVIKPQGFSGAPKRH